MDRRSGVVKKRICAQGNKDKALSMLYFSINAAMDVNK